MRIRRALTLPALLTLAVAVAACGGSPSDVAPTSTSAASDGHDMDDSSYSFGAPATSGATVDQVIEVVQSDDMRFTPDAVEVVTGETVQFDVTDAGSCGARSGLQDARDRAAGQPVRRPRR